MDNKQALAELKQLLEGGSPAGGPPPLQQSLHSIGALIVAAPAGERREALAETGGPAAAAGQEIESLISRLAELADVAKEQARTTEVNTQAVVENSLAQLHSSEGSKAGSIGRTLLSFLGGGLGVVQLLGKLFDSGNEPAAALPTYTLPSPVAIDAGLPGGVSGLQPVRYGADSLPRPAGTAAPVVQPAVTIQVQALDSRSILDHSAEIAEAVREALLNSHALGDVVTEI